MKNLDRRLSRAKQALGPKPTRPTVITIYAEEGEAIEDEWRGRTWCCILRVPPGTGRGKEELLAALTPEQRSRLWRGANVYLNTGPREL